MPDLQTAADAATWLVMQHSPEYTERMRDDFARWLSESPEHEEAYKRALRVWRDAGPALSG